MKKLLRISILTAILAGVITYVLTPNDSVLYFGQNGPHYGSLSSRSVDDPNRSDAPYLGMNTRSASNVSVSKNGPQIKLQSAGSYVRKDSSSPRRISSASMNGGGASGSAVSHAPANNVVAAGGVAYSQFPSFSAHNDRKKVSVKDNDEDIVETGSQLGVNIHGGGPAVGGQVSHDTPIGDAVLPLLLLLAVFVAVKRFK